MESNVNETYLYAGKSCKQKLTNVMLTIFGKPLQKHLQIPANVRGVNLESAIQSKMKFTENSTMVFARDSPRQREKENISLARRKFERNKFAKGEKFVGGEMIFNSSCI